jgi:hypothetical protein
MAQQPVQRQLPEFTCISACNALKGMPFIDEWINLLPSPEDVIADEQRMVRLREHVLYVTVVDMQWNRRDWLFELVRDALLGRGCRDPPKVVDLRMRDIERRHANGDREIAVNPGTSPDATHLSRDFERCSEALRSHPRIF